MQQAYSQLQLPPPPPPPLPQYPPPPPPPPPLPQPMAGHVSSPPSHAIAMQHAAGAATVGSPDAPPALAASSATDEARTLSDKDEGQQQPPRQSMRDGTKPQPRTCACPVARRTLADLKNDEKKTGIRIPADLPPDFPRGPWVVDLSKPPDHAPGSGCHDGGQLAAASCPSSARCGLSVACDARGPHDVTGGRVSVPGWKYQEEQMVVQWKCWCSDPNTPLECPGLDPTKYSRGGPAFLCDQCIRGRAARASHPRAGESRAMTLVSCACSPARSAARRRLSAGRHHSLHAHLGHRHRQAGSVHGAIRG